MTLTYSIAVGLIMGFIIGSWSIYTILEARAVQIADINLGSVSIIQYGAGPNGMMRTLGKYMAGSGATFG